MTKLTAFAEDKLNVNKMAISPCCRLENTVGKEENAVFQGLFLWGCYKSGLCGKGVKHLLFAGFGPNRIGRGWRQQLNV